MRSPARRGWVPATASTPRASCSVIVIGPGDGSRTTSSCRPRASVAALQPLLRVARDRVLGV